MHVQYRHAHRRWTQTPAFPCPSSPERLAKVGGRVRPARQTGHMLLCDWGIEVSRVRTAGTGPCGVPV
jgi:hypothetical protein